MFKICCWIQVMSLMMIKTQGMMHLIYKQNQQYQKQVLLKRLQYLKLRRREDHEVLTIKLEKIVISLNPSQLRKRF